MKKLASIVILVSAVGLFGGCGGDTKKLTATSRVASPCVRPGSKQTITVKTLGESKIAYAIQYPSGKGEEKPPLGTVPKNGTFVGTFAIGSDEPAGKVSVTVLLANGSQTLKHPVTFNVGTDPSCV